MASTLRGGFGRREITPQKPCFLVGYPHVERTSTGVHDPLYASALCLEFDGKTVLFISLDILFVSAEWTRDCRESISRSTGIPGEAILIGATHTHSAPHTVEILAWKDDPVVPPVDPHYLAFLREQTLAAAVGAWKSRASVGAAWTSVDVRGIAGGNRIAAHGPEDPEAGLLLIRRESDGSRLGSGAKDGMHPTVLLEDSPRVSSDFIGFTRQVMENAFPGVGMVYLNGVCGDQSPRRVVTAQTFAEAARIGEALGERFVEALRKAGSSEEPFRISFGTRTLRIEGRKFCAVEEAERNLERARAEFERLRVQDAPKSAVRTAECTVFGAEEVLTLAKAEVSGEAEAIREKYRFVEIQAFSLGDVFVVAWPGEFFVEYGLELKRRAPRKIHVVTMANGELHGYIVTPEAEAARGYEAQMSLFSPAVGTDFVETSLALLREQS